MNLIIPIISAFFSLVGLALAVAAFRHTRSREATKDLKEKFDQVDDALRRVLVLETKIDVFWKQVAFSSAQALHSPHAPELDYLIERFQQERLNDAELREFKHRLNDIVDDPQESAFRQKSAREVLALIHVRYEIAVGA